MFIVFPRDVTFADLVIYNGVSKSISKLDFQVDLNYFYTVRSDLQSISIDRIRKSLFWDEPKTFLPFLCTLKHTQTVSKNKGHSKIIEKYLKINDFEFIRYIGGGNAETFFRIFKRLPTPVQQICLNIHGWNIFRSIHLQNSFQFNPIALF